MLRKDTNTCAVQPQFSKAVEARFHQLDFFGVPLFLSIIRHMIAHFLFKSSVLYKL